MPAPRKRQRTLTQVIVDLPNSVELTKRRSKNSMTVEIRRGTTLLGTMVMGRGSVQWWPSGNSVNALKKTWESFAAMLDAHM
jgi:predicted RNA-binding protein YlqC (UPF0109 family)